MNSGISRDDLECSQGHQDDIPTPLQPGSGSGHFRAQIHRPGTVSDLINFVSFGRLFCPGLDQAIFVSGLALFATDRIVANGHCALMACLACPAWLAWPA